MVHQLGKANSLLFPSPSYTINIPTNNSQSNPYLNYYFLFLKKKNEMTEMFVFLNGIYYNNICNFLLFKSCLNCLGLLIENY